MHTFIRSRAILGLDKSKETYKKIPDREVCDEFDAVKYTLCCVFLFCRVVMGVCLRLFCLAMLLWFLSYMCIREHIVE